VEVDGPASEQPVLDLACAEKLVDRRKGCELIIFTHAASVAKRE
jgi:hypothetical protein